MARQESLPNGRAAAAILAAGIGSLALGLLTTLPEGIVPLRQALNFYNPAGPLSGKTAMAVVVWLVAWIALHGLWANREVAFGKVVMATLVLIGLGVLGTFPIFFELFRA
jgi:hypothetical protein